MASHTFDIFILHQHIDNTLYIYIQQHIGVNTDNKVLTHTSLCKHAYMTAANMAVSKLTHFSHEMQLT